MYLIHPLIGSSGKYNTILRKEEKCTYYKRRQNIHRQYNSKHRNSRRIYTSIIRINKSLARLINAKLIYKYIKLYSITAIY